MPRGVPVVVNISKKSLTGRLASARKAQSRYVKPVAIVGIRLDVVFHMVIWGVPQRASNDKGGEECVGLGLSAKSKVMTKSNRDAFGGLVSPGVRPTHLRVSWHAS